MSDLRIGQRCRLVNVKDARNPEWRGCEGDEVTILGLPGSCLLWPDQYEVTMPAHHPGGRSGYFARREVLRPLTDPGADAFMERIKRLGREPINLAEKVTR